MNPRDFILSRSGAARRTRDGYWAYLPDPLPPLLDWSPALLTALSDAERSLGELAATTRLVPGYGSLAPLLDTHEAACSCEIDMLTASLPALLQSLYIPGSPLDDQPGIVAWRAYHEALTAIRSRPVNFSTANLTNLHSQMMGRGIAAPEAGHVRSHQNWVGPPGSSLETATFVPPPPERLERGLEQLESFINSETRLPGIVRLALAHYQFEALHPFPSGNGRLGRLLASSLPIYMQDLDHPLLPISEYLLTHRQQYFDMLLAVSQRSAWEEWLVFFLTAVTSSARKSTDRLAALQDLYQRYQETIAPARTSARLERMLDFAISQPLFTIRQAEAALGVNFAVAQRYVNQIEAYGIVEEITGQARNRIYRLRGILDILI
jgi:Fic family protein